LHYALAALATRGSCATNPSYEAADALAEPDLVAPAKCVQAVDIQQLPRYAVRLVAIEEQLR
jgi:hypothetical protein